MHLPTMRNTDDKNNTKHDNSTTDRASNNTTNRGQLQLIFSEGFCPEILLSILGADNRGSHGGMIALV